MSYWDGADGGYPDDYPYDDEPCPIHGGTNCMHDDEDTHDYSEEAYNRQLMDDPNA